MVLNLVNEMSPIKIANIGDRIECGGHFGTVKYIGIVEGYDNIWLGIDWDDPLRGKHNGTVNGIRYFTTSYEKSGSFVRPEKVQLGQSVIKAITSRYGQRDDAVTAKLTEQELLSIQKCMNAPFVELVGFEKVTDKQSDFNSLEIINLRLQNVSSTGSPNELKQICPNIMELDISKNLLTNWISVFNICSQLEHLEWLNVSENLLIIPENTDRYQFSNLKVLICGMMKLNWSNILQLEKVFPNIEELRAPVNNIHYLNTQFDEFKNLKLLDLEGNQIKEWSEISKLSVITSLEHLNLENTGIETIQFDDTNIFRNLKKLIISQNFINDWQSIGELNKLPQLEDFRFLKNPILETETYETSIQLVIARIANLKMFNGALIKSAERKGAEYDYIKKYGLEWLSVKDNPEQKLTFLSKYNRYEELIKKHGTLEESELVIQSKLIKVSLIEIQFIHGERSVIKKLPPTILIQKVIQLAQRLFNLENRPNLTYICNAKSEIEIELDDEGKDLGFYSIEEGDKIIVKS